MNRLTIVLAVLVVAAAAFNFYRPDTDQLLVRNTRAADSKSSESSEEKEKKEQIEGSGEGSTKVESSGEPSDAAKNEPVIERDIIVEGSGTDSQVTSAPLRFVRDVDGSGSSGVEI